MAGNPYGIDVHHGSAFSDDHTFSSSVDSGFDSGFGSSSFNDPFSQ